MIQSQRLQISPASKNRALIYHESAKSFGHGQSPISSPSHGYCNVFFVGNFLKIFGSGQSDKKHIEIPMTRGRDKRLAMPKGFEAFVVNQRAVL